MSRVAYAAAAVAVAGLLAARASSQRAAAAAALAAEAAAADAKAADAPIYKFVLTGGPCAGKTTAMARLSSFLRERGFRVFTVPEAATMLFTNGATFRDLETDEGQMNFQIQLMNLQLFLEDTYEGLARNTGKPSVLLCDRGAMDGSAYLDAATWQALLRTTGRDVVSLRDGRYNAVFHLVTAALGAESFYTLENNVARLETVEEARDLDGRLLRAWLGHPQLCVVDNATDFEGKMQRLVDQAGKLVGLPVLAKAARKFVLASLPDMDNFPVRVERFEVDKSYLRTNSADDNEYTFVRRRSQNGLSAYGQTTVRVTGGEQVEVKRIITSREFAYAVSQRADPDRHIVKQVRYSFIVDDCSYQIHQYLTPRAGLCLLHCQTSSASSSAPDKVELPAFLDVVGEADPQLHSAYRISLKNPGVPGGSPPVSPSPSRSPPPILR